MKRYIIPTISSKEVDSLIQKGYSNLNPNFVIKEVLRVLGVNQKDYSKYLKKNPNYISDRLSNPNSKKFTIKDIFILKNYVESNFPKINFNSLIRDSILTEGLNGLSISSIIRRYEWVIKQLMEANQFTYAEYQAKISSSDAWT